MAMRRLSFVSGVVAVLATMSAALTGCSTTVHVDPPSPTGAAAEACRRLGVVLPHALDGANRTMFEPASSYVSVWGDGEIMLRCGVPRPTEMAPTDEVSDINGVGWFSDPRRPLLFTAVNRVAYVEVTISKKHIPGEVLVDLADPIKKTIPE
ncbi:DUF3515 domain-containing protein [Sphaerimonospora cavernae]|uniref:DUF3515 domain-containing protein n=1 Tax=Sphaerimonospora cavernae TaxID=1740611 RepID=A0ABV6U200_9ACTN